MLPKQVSVYWRHQLESQDLSKLSQQMERIFSDQFNISAPNGANLKALFLSCSEISA